MGLVRLYLCRGMACAENRVVIVGGGLSGLTAAVQLGRMRVPTVLFDDADEIGGRARTDCREGFHMNVGPHRLYERGAAVSGLRALGVPLDSAPRGPRFAIWRGSARPASWRTRRYGGAIQAAQAAGQLMAAG